VRRSVGVVGDVVLGRRRDAGVLHAADVATAMRAVRGVSGKAFEARPLSGVRMMFTVGRENVNALGSRLAPVRRDLLDRLLVPRRGDAPRAGQQRGRVGVVKWVPLPPGPPTS
jgi:hypothetical protein